MSKLRLTERRMTAKMRRELDIKKYQELSKTEVPQILEGVTYTNGKEWKELCADKLKKAEKDVKILEEKLSVTN